MEGKLYYSFTKMQIPLLQVCVQLHIVHMLPSLHLCVIEEEAALHSGNLVPAPSKHRMKRVLATDGYGDPLNGICIFFLRPNNSKQVSTSNMVEVYCKFGTA